MNEDPKKRLWWQTEILYQIYPRSFQDSNGDGIGDLSGILSRLDHFAWLGVKGIWISPIYPSPMADFGYDISNYENIHPLFGSLDDFDLLLKEIHARDMKLILDFVPNHTSDQHPWFQESRASKDNPKRNWYLWHDAKENGTVPNNWLAAFGGSAWEWDEKTQQYYYHAFLKEQPDLNWRNEEVQKAMLDTMRFWLDRGVDGFRVDVMWHLIKDEKLRDNPLNPNYQPQMATYDQLLPVYSTDQPEVHDIVRKMREVLDEYDDRMMIGEVYLPINKLVTYYGSDGKGAHLPFNFQLLLLPWDPHQITMAISEYEGALPSDAWPNWVLGNHDQARIASRIGSEQARIAAMLLLTLRGTPTVYYGDEICMRDVPIPFSEIQDPQGLNMPDKNLSRDPARTPMQWSNEPNAGFTTGKSWLPIDRDYARKNVKEQRQDNYSMLCLYKKLIALRAKEISLREGTYTPVYSDHQLISYIREKEGAPRFLIILNLSHRTSYFRAPGVIIKGSIEVSTSPEIESMQVNNIVELSGDEGVIIRLE